MLIIGIDPGLAKTGWGIIKKEGNRLSFIAAGTIETKVESNIASRLLIIYDGIFAVLEKFQPTHAAMEETFVNEVLWPKLKDKYIENVVKGLENKLDAQYKITIEQI